MIFGEKTLDVVGCAKVTAWRNGLSSSFDRQQITYRGAVIASVEVPTIRTIEADILVRGKSLHVLKMRLNAIADWLYSSGTAKLSTSKDPAHYYKARCTQISTPAYNGLSARITATFVCTDYRLYSVYDNQPIGTLAANLGNFTFAGKHCLNDMGCVFVMSSFDLLGQPRLNRYIIPGQNGTLRYDANATVYEARSLQGDLYLVTGTAHDGAMTQDQIDEQKHKIASWLGNAGRAYLILDSDTTRRYIAEVDDRIVAYSGQDLDWVNGSIKLKLSVQPYSEDVTAQSKTSSLSLSANTYQTISLTSAIPRGIGYVTPLVITITNSGSSAVTDLYVSYYDEKDTAQVMRLNGNGFSLGASQSVVIDGTKPDVLQGGSSNIKWLASGDFPVLSVNGTKSIKIKTAAASSLSVTVSLNARWL